MGFKVKIEGLNEGINNLEHYIERKKRGLLGVVAGSSTAIQNTAKQLAPADLGELREEIFSTVIERRDSISGDVLSAADYSAYVEFGARPHWTSVRNLEGWAERHGISPYAVQYSIAKKGTPAQPFMTPAAVKEKNNFVRGVKIVMSSP